MQWYTCKSLLNTLGRAVEQLAGCLAKQAKVSSQGQSTTVISLIPRPRGRREKWPGIHCLRIREKPHDFMGCRIPSFTKR